jgi:hypothetical protein
MQRYYQIGVDDDKILRASSPKKFLIVSVAGFVLGAVTILLAYFVSRLVSGLDYTVIFNLCLIFVFVVGAINSVAVKIHQGILVLIANLIAFWGFNQNADYLVLDIFVFSVGLALASGCFYQIFRLRKMSTACVFALLVAIAIHLI